MQARRSAKPPFRVQVVSGLGDTAWLWRDTLWVGRAETPAATRERVARATSAALRKL
jgi:hypothetical protein